MIRIEVPDAASAKGLVQLLAGAFEPTSVLLDADAGEVRLEEKGASSQSVGQILGSLEAWLEMEGVESATVWLDDSQYTLARRPEPMASGQ